LIVKSALTGGNALSNSDEKNPDCARSHSESGANRELTATHDPADNRFLECAEALKADYLVTGNKRHFPTEWRQTQVVNAWELLEWTIPELRP
jgi:predicted nucleic acid-binding protein